MTFPYKAVLFDWAYTLVNLVKEDDHLAFLKMTEFLKGKGIKLPDFQILFHSYQDIFYGLIDDSHKTHREACFESVLRHIFFIYGIEINGRALWEEILIVYYEVIHSVRILYPDVLETLEILRRKGVRMGVISNTTNPSFIKCNEMHRFNLSQYFEFALYSSTTPYRKPHPSIYLDAVSRLKINVKDILFVGDNLMMDVKGPQEVGISAVWLNRNKAALSSGIVPKYEISRLSDLIQVVHGKNYN